MGSSIQSGSSPPKWGSQLLWQLLVTLIGTTLFAFQGLEHLFAALYGGGVAMVVTLWLWRCEIGSRSQLERSQLLRLMVRCSLERAVLAGSLFAVAMGLLNLAALPLLVLFAVCQLPVFVAGMR
ncbi:hypothetical protein D5085_09395 [Ectothiorhodospiraceae bacterium BW-2]|nr:hypothetical protein D5085_09395 [Ectothiorhodospiraceae bacterium BW-2]